MDVGNSLVFENVIVCLGRVLSYELMFRKFAYDSVSSFCIYEHIFKYMFATVRTNEHFEN